MVSAWAKYVEEVVPETLRWELANVSTTSVLIDMDEVAEDVPLWKSKVGGAPYLPLDSAYPKTAEEKPLRMLAQLNMADVKREAGVVPKGFPEHGIISFWIYNDETGGMDFQNMTSDGGSRVLYFPDVMEDPLKLHREFPIHYPGHPHRLEDGSLCESIKECTQDEDGVINPKKISSMKFEAENQCITEDDYRFQRLGEMVSSELSELVTRYNDQSEGCYVSRIGGYPHFTQEDPRGGRAKYDEYTVLLLQLGSEGPVTWGDCGVGAFFHNPAALKDRDFTGALYNWDCS